AGHSGAAGWSGCYRPGPRASPGPVRIARATSLGIISHERPPHLPKVDDHGVGPRRYGAPDGRHRTGAWGMTASGTASVLATLLTGVRVTAVALAAAILVAVVRGEPLNLQGLLSVPREVENVISASVTRSDGHDAAVPTTKAQV